MSLRHVLFGRPLTPADEARERIGSILGLPLLGLDALSSAAYGPEALLTALLPLGFLALRYVVPLTLVIVVLLAAVALSYWQTIAAYPNGGGSYTVAKENIGRTGSLVAAAALGLDYVLTVAVGISAGIGAVVSAIPALLPHTLSLCLAVLLVMTLVNLRGVRASAGAFALPTLAFVGSLAVVVLLGLARAVAHGSTPPALAPPPPPPAVAMTAATPWLLMRAFANGTSAMTGVEAISNAVPLFREPRVERARRTLAAVALLLTALLVGIAVLCRAYRVTATTPGQTGYQSVVSQLTAAVLGRGLAYGVCMGTVVVALTFSANTSFADFPRVGRLLAEDHFLPAAFGRRGRRLVFTYGILVLSALSAVLLVAFRGITNRLIPLYAIGALLAFTMSQAGMVVHWRKAHVNGPRLWLNAIGASATGATVVILFVSKFVEGAWISVLVILAFTGLLTAIRRHEEGVDRLTRSDAPLDVARPPRTTVAVVPIVRWDRVASKTLRWALGFVPEVVVVQLLADDRPQDDLTGRWPELAETPAARAGLPAPKLVVLRSTYRHLLAPLIGCVGRLVAENPDRQLAVVVPQLAEERWYRMLAPFDLASVVREMLLVRGRTPVLVVSAPCYLQDWEAAAERRRPEDPTT